MGGISPKSQFTLPLSAHGQLEALNLRETLESVRFTPSLCLSEGACPSRICLQALQTACIASTKLNLRIHIRKHPGIEAFYTPNHLLICQTIYVSLKFYLIVVNCGEVKVPLNRTTLTYYNMVGLTQVQILHN